MTTGPKIKKLPGHKKSEERTLQQMAINSSPKPNGGVKSTIKPQKKPDQGTQLSYNKICFRSSLVTPFIWILHGADSVIHH
jgi:hypothetical protein